MARLLLFLSFLCAFRKGYCQNNNIPGIFCCRIVPQVLVLSGGDSSRAILAKHHEFRGNAMVAQLGYIDTSYASVTELRNNIQIGLVAVPGLGYTVVEFSVALLPKGKDYQGPYPVAGNKICPCRSPQVERLLSWVRTGDRIIFDGIKALRPGSDHTIPLNPIMIRITE